MITRRDEHLPLRWLVDDRDGVLSGRRATEVAEHLASGCETCTDRRASLERTISAIASGPLSGPLDTPRAAPLADVLGLYAQTHRSGGWPPECEVAELLLDQRSELTPALRSAAGSERRLLFAWDGCELDASVAARARGADVRGQVLLATDDPDVPVEGRVTASCGRYSETRTLRPDGRFDLPAVPPGALVIAGVVANRPFRLPPVLID